MKSDGQPLVRKTFLKRLGWVLGLVLLLAWAWPCPFNYFSVCPTCAQTRCSTAWEQNGSSHFTYWRSHRLEHTPVSMVLEKHGLAQNHEHDWIFGQGGGNGVKCAIGPGRHLLPTYDSTNVAAFVDALAQYGGQQALEKWRIRMANRDLSRLCWNAANNAPAGVFSSKERFLEWLPKEEEDMSEREQMFVEEAAKRTK